MTKVEAGGGSWSTRNRPGQYAEWRWYISFYWKENDHGWQVRRRAKQNSGDVAMNQGKMHLHTAVARVTWDVTRVSFEFTVGTKITGRYLFHPSIFDSRSFSTCPHLVPCRIAK